MRFEQQAAAYKCIAQLGLISEYVPVQCTVHICTCIEQSEPVVLALMIFGRTRLLNRCGWCVAYRFNEKGKECI